MVGSICHLFEGTVERQHAGRLDAAPVSCRAGYPRETGPWLPLLPAVPVSAVRQPFMRGEGFPGDFPGNERRIARENRREKREKIRVSLGEKTGRCAHPTANMAITGVPVSQLVLCCDRLELCARPCHRHTRDFPISGKPPFSLISLDPFSLRVFPEMPRYFPAISPRVSLSSPCPGNTRLPCRQGEAHRRDQQRQVTSESACDSGRLPQTSTIR